MAATRVQFQAQLDSCLRSRQSIIKTGSSRDANWSVKIQEFERPAWFIFFMRSVTLQLDLDIYHPFFLNQKDSVVMALVDLQKLKSLVTAGSSAHDESERFKQLLFMILTKAARVDLHTDAAEVDLIQKIMLEYTGEAYEAATIRAEATAQSQENSLRPISKLASTLPENLRVLAVSALKEVMGADERVSYAEIDYFNAVAGAMRLSFADVAGLLQD